MLIRNKNLFLFALFLFFVISFFINTKEAFALTTAKFSPCSGTYRVGDTIRVKVLVESDKPINGFSSNVSFSNNTLSLSSISKSSSIIDLWPREAVSSNSEGFANFEGVSLSGYTGDAGNIITLVFKAKSIGEAVLKFTDVSILANDGEGTDIFSGGFSTATFNIEKALDIPKAEDKPTPTCPNIEQESPVHCIIISTAEKIREVEISNGLPNNSLLLAIIILLIIIFSFIVIYLFLTLSKLKKYLKNKLLKTECVIDEDFKTLKKDIRSRIIDDRIAKDAKISEEQEFSILEEIDKAEDKIIKEVDRDRDEI